MKRLLVLILLAVAACGQADPPVDPWPGLANYQVGAKDAMTASLKDPASAKYQDVMAHRYQSGYVFCGAVNAKNGFGGYMGFTRFVALPGMAVLESGTKDFEAFSSVACAGEGKVVWF